MVVGVTIFHIAAAAAWFGHKLLIPRDLHDSIHDVSGSEAFIRRMARAERLGITMGVLTLLSGVALIYLTTGFSDTPLRIWLGLAAVVAMFVVGATVARPAWRKIETGLLAEDAPAAASGVVPFTRALTLENILWLLALTSMVL